MIKRKDITGNKTKTNIDIEIQKSEDIRSYHINSQKIYDILGFKPNHTIENAVLELCNFFKSRNIKDSFENDIYHNVKRLRSLNAK